MMSPIIRSNNQLLPDAIISVTSVSYGYYTFKIKKLNSEKSYSLKFEEIEEKGWIKFNFFYDFERNLLFICSYVKNIYIYKYSIKKFELIKIEDKEDSDNIKSPFVFLKEFDYSRTKSTLNINFYYHEESFTLWKRNRHEFLDRFSFKFEDVGEGEDILTVKKMRIDNNDFDNQSIQLRQNPFIKSGVDCYIHDKKLFFTTIGGYLYAIKIQEDEDDNNNDNIEMDEPKVDENKQRWQILINFENELLDSYYNTSMKYDERLGILIIITNHYEIKGIKFNTKEDGLLRAEIVLNTLPNPVSKIECHNQISYRKEKGQFYILDTMDNTISIVQILGPQGQPNENEGYEGYEVIVQKKRLYQYGKFNELRVKQDPSLKYQIDFENSMIYLFKRNRHSIVGVVRYY